jgi:hypothetical protein
MKVGVSRLGGYQALDVRFIEASFVYYCLLGFCEGSEKASI